MSGVQKDDPSFTVVEAGAYLDLSIQTIRIKIRAGVMRATKPGREWRIRRSELDRYEASTANILLGSEPGGHAVVRGASRAEEILASTR